MSIERVMRVGDIVDSRREAGGDQSGDAIEPEADQSIIDRSFVGGARFTDMRFGALRARRDIEEERLGAVARRAGTGELG